MCEHVCCVQVCFDDSQVLIIIHVHFQLQSLEFVVHNHHAYNIHVHNNRNVHNEHSYMFIIIQLFTIKINIFVRIAFGTLKNLLRQNVHWPCSVPNKLMYHGKFPVEHGRVRTRLLGTPEYR